VLLSTVRVSVFLAADKIARNAGSSYYIKDKPSKLVVIINNIKIMSLCINGQLYSHRLYLLMLRWYMMRDAAQSEWNHSCVKFCKSVITSDSTCWGITYCLHNNICRFRTYVSFCTYLLYT